ncbi:hypothetical protein HYY74_07415 [Candidatus Woesearchaeota archaeon]|nr:hypothetical protein [Candidatus Woesearchaeota archaeon]
MADLSKIVNEEFKSVHPVRADAVAEFYARFYAKHPYFKDGNGAVKFLNAARAAIYAFALRSDGMPRLGFDPDSAYSAIKLTLAGYDDSEAARLAGLGELDFRRVCGEALHITRGYISAQAWDEKYLRELEEIAAGKGYREPRPSESFLLGIIREHEQNPAKLLREKIVREMGGKEPPQVTPRQSPYIDNPWYNYPICDSGLNARVLHTMVRYGKQVLGELTLMTEVELLSDKTRNVGKASVDEIRKCLGYAGMALYGEEPYPFPKGEELLWQPVGFLYPKEIAGKLAHAGLTTLGETAVNHQLVRKVLGQASMDEFYRKAAFYRLINEQ